MNPKNIPLHTHHENTIKLLIEKMDQLQATIDSSLSNMSTPTIIVQNAQTIQNTQNMQNTQNNFYLRSLGMETIDHISPQVMSGYIKDVQFIELVKTINFNPLKPENHNVKRINKDMEFCNNPYLKFYADGAWNKCSKDYVLKNVVKNIKEVFTSNLNNMLDRKEICSQEYSQISQLVNDISNDENTPKSIFALTASDEFFDSGQFNEIMAQFNDLQAHINEPRDELDVKSINSSSIVSKHKKLETKEKEDSDSCTSEGSRYLASYLQHIRDHEDYVA